MTITDPTIGRPVAGGDAELVLEVRDLSVRFPRPGGADIDAVRDVSLAVAAGSRHMILGESGSGKSVSLKAVLGMLPSGARVGGTIRYRGRDLLDLGAADAARIRGRNGIGFVPQQPRDAFDPLRKIGPQLVEVLRTHGMAAGRSEARQRALLLLAEVGLPRPQDVAKAYPYQLSGGICQRAAVAMAIATEPSALICDEPTTALDVTVQAIVLDLFDRLCRERGMALVVVTHDVDVAADLGGSLSLMYAGRIVERGPIAPLLAAPAHPYLQGLLRSRPIAGHRQERLVPIPGSPPNPSALPSGCAFHPRCPLAIDRCAEERPVLVPLSPVHDAACLLVGGDRS